MPKFKKLIAICGVGRSGTSLLQSMLNAHPKICFTPETHFFRKYVANTRKRERIEAGGAAEFMELLRSDKQFHRLGLDVDFLLAPYVLGSKQFLLLEFYLSNLHLYCNPNNDPRILVGDKDPNFIDCLSQLSKILPAATIVHIIRDPRDVLVSRINANWSAKYPWWLHPIIYRVKLLSAQDNGVRLFGDRYIEIFYESLIQNPEKNIRELCSKLDVEYHSNVLNFSTTSRELISEEELQWKSNLLGPLISNNQKKWDKKLSAFQIQYTETVCGHVFHQGSYKICDKTNIGNAKRLLLLVLIMLLPAVDIFYRIRIRIRYS